MGELLLHYTTKTIKKKVYSCSAIPYASDLVSKGDHSTCFQIVSGLLYQPFKSKELPKALKDLTSFAPVVMSN